MARVKRGVTAHAKHKKVLEQAKGFYGRRKNTITVANAAVDRSLQHNYVGRKLKKRVYRNVFTLRINAAAREYGFSYSRMIDALKKAGITLDRKSLSTLAKDHPEIFARIAKQLKA